MTVSIAAAQSRFAAATAAMEKRASDLNHSRCYTPSIAELIDAVANVELSLTAIHQWEQRQALHNVVNALHEMERREIRATYAARRAEKQS